MQDKELTEDRSIPIREYLHKNLTVFEFNRLHLALGVTPHRLARMLNYRNSSIWKSDQLVALIKKLELEILPSEFLKQTGLLHDLSQWQVEALDTYLLGNKD